MTEIKVGNGEPKTSEYTFPNPQKAPIRQSLEAIFNAINSLTNSIERLEKKISELSKEIK